MGNPDLNPPYQPKERTFTEKTSSERLAIGTSIFEYAWELQLIMDELSSALLDADAADEAINDRGVYEGQARDELAAFYGSYAANVEKLRYYYSLANQFLGNLVDTLDLTDEQLVGLVANYMDRG